MPKQKTFNQWAGLDHATCKIAVPNDETFPIRQTSRVEVMDETIKRIAKKKLSLKTLEERNMDSLDFHEHAVWEIKAALEAAYKAGQKTEKKRAASITAAKPSHSPNNENSR